MFLLAGGGLTTCRWGGCQKPFEKKTPRQRFCKEQCRVNFHTRANYRKKNPVKEVRRKCRQCKEFFFIDNRALGVKRKYCSNSCRSKYSMRRCREKMAKKKVKDGPPLHEVITDGITVWVNGAGSCLARFGVNGIDIHKALSKRVKSGSECLFCTHATTTKEDWDLFVVKMLDLYKIPIRDRFLPKRFR
jgi:hypothetical protein